MPLPFPVALRKESVDRNRTCIVNHLENTASLSARRAWIEIAMLIYSALVRVVALRKESVDRNVIITAPQQKVKSSLSARRAWIEIRVVVQSNSFCVSRSPQGERG